MEIPLNSLKMFLCGTNPSSTSGLSFSAHIIERSMSSKKPKRIIGTLISICFLALLLLCLRPHCLALAPKHSSPSSHLCSFLWCGVYLLFGFSKIHILKAIPYPTPQHTLTHSFVAISTTSFLISLTGSVVNAVESCTTSEHSFPLRNLLFQA